MVDNTAEESKDVVTPFTNMKKQSTAFGKTLGMRSTQVTLGIDGTNSSKNAFGTFKRGRNSHGGLFVATQKLNNDSQN